MIAVAGEALIDLIESAGVLRPYPGGGPFNTAVVNEGGMPKGAYTSLVSWSKGAAKRGQIRAAR